MRKVIYYVAPSIDGFIAGKNHDLSWLMEGNDENNYGYSEFTKSVDTILFGSKTYEISKSFGEWPFKQFRNIVFTSREFPKDEHVEFAIDAVETTKKLLKEEGENIWLMGGSKIAGALLNEGLIDELVLSVHPIFLGEGIPLFENAKETKLKFEKLESFDTGLVQLTYSIIK